MTFYKKDGSKDGCLGCMFPILVILLILMGICGFH